MTPDKDGTLNDELKDFPILLSTIQQIRIQNSDFVSKLNIIDQDKQNENTKNEERTKIMENQKNWAFLNIIFGLLLIIILYYSWLYSYIKQKEVKGITFLVTIIYIVLRSYDSLIVTNYDLPHFKFYYNFFLGLILFVGNVDAISFNDLEKINLAETNDYYFWLIYILILLDLKKHKIFSLYNLYYEIFQKWLYETKKIYIRHNADLEINPSNLIDISNFQNKCYVFHSMNPVEPPFFRKNISLALKVSFLNNLISFDYFLRIDFSPENYTILKLIILDQNYLDYVPELFLWRNFSEFRFEMKEEYLEMDRNSNIFGPLEIFKDVRHPQIIRMFLISQSLKRWFLERNKNEDEVKNDLRRRSSFKG